MIKLVTQFIDWIKNLISLVLGVPSFIASFVSDFSLFLGFMPSSLGTVIMGFISFLVVFVLVFFIVKLVVSLI